MENVNNNGKGITGYRDLTKEEIALMNRAKDLSSEVGLLVKELQEKDGLDQRWISIGTTDIQKGFMSLIRGIAQPTTF